MSIRRSTTVVIYVCDACGKRFLIEESDEPISGLSGSVCEIAAGGHTAHWWACKRAHVGKAIANALDRDDQEDWELS